MTMCTPKPNIGNLHLSAMKILQGQQSNAGGNASPTYPVDYPKQI